MKHYKVVDDRNYYRNKPNYEITHDTENSFIVVETATNDNGKFKRVLVLNPKQFQEERIVDEAEAIVLKLQGIKVVEVNNEQ